MAATCGRGMLTLSPALATMVVMEATDLVMDLATEAMGMAATCGRGMPRLSPALATMVVMEVTDLAMEATDTMGGKRTQHNQPGKATEQKTGHNTNLLQKNKSHRLSPLLSPHC